MKSMVSDRKTARVVGKSVRACDNCARKRASWYCAADDAFLCESCDSSVHTANPLARRHERVRLKFASDDESDEGFKVCVPSWHQGFTKKARTPRQKKHGKLSNPLRLVPEPEVCSEEESEEQLLYRVPVFEVAANTAVENRGGSKSKADESLNEFVFAHEMNHFLPSELDLADFAADVESLLGKGLDDESFDMEGLGIYDVKEERECCFSVIKDEDEEIGEASRQIDVGREMIPLNFDYASPITYVDDENENKFQNQELILRSECKVDDSNKVLLKLDYERVISAWDEKKSPWTTGEKPEFSSHGWWPTAYSLGTSETLMHAYGEMGMRSGRVGAAAGGDGGREARVSRYREKRRTRLFSKKIRYEVRKLNAEKRPRMKGRFVKRASFAASAFPLLNK